MFQRFRTNALAKKTSIFVAVFAVTCILMGNKMRPVGDLESLTASEALSVQAGQTVISEASASETGSVVIEAESSGLLQLPPSFSFTGEYPAIQASPIPAKPLVEINLPTADGFVYSDSIPLSYELQQYTYSQCVNRGLEYELVLALMWRESRFEVDAVNINTDGTQDSGIMQINDVNRGWLKEKYGIENLMDPKQNIAAGTIMLSSFTHRHGVHDGLMAYQYGEEGMKQKIREGVVTNDKISILLEKRNDYREILHNA